MSTQQRVSRAGIVFAGLAIVLSLLVAPSRAEQAAPAPSVEPQQSCCACCAPADSAQAKVEGSVPSAGCAHGEGKMACCQGKADGEKACCQGKADGEKACCQAKAEGQKSCCREHAKGEGCCAGACCAGHCKGHGPGHHHHPDHAS